MPFLWLVFGGNGGLSLDYRRHAQRWSPDFAYVYVDYPGYGLCEGKPNPAHMSETMKALRVVMQEKLKRTPGELAEFSGVWGHSLGCAAGLICAEEWGIKRALLCAPFTTMTDMARQLVGSPLCYLNRHPYDNIERLQSLKNRGGRAIAFHAIDDGVIPVAMCEELGKRFPDTLTVHILDTGNHNEIIDSAGEAIAKAAADLATRK